MKKITILLSAVAGLLFSSCNMDQSPIGTLDDVTAIQNVTDLRNARNGIYDHLRSCVTGGYIYLTDLQMDQFMGLTINGNRNGIMAHGTILSNNSSIEGVWAGMYADIADANYFLGRADVLLENPNLNEDQVHEINRYIAEVKFARAYFYYMLFDRFCDTYSAAEANTPAKGLPLTTVFNPTGDVSSYPGRSTMAETFALIDGDLSEAYQGLQTWERYSGETATPMAMYVNSNTVLALEARLALLRSNWTGAINLAQELINTGVYTLAGVSGTTYLRMWTQDTANELIFRPISSNTELGISSTGGAYISDNVEAADYIPTYETLLYYDDNDIRFDCYFEPRNLNANGQYYPAYTFIKYPGNAALQTGTNNNLMNMGKPFRLSETYLILAEAAAQAGENDIANAALTTLRQNRIRNYRATTYNGEELIQQIREERTKELLGEGFRMSDLRRWGLGFTRDASYPPNPAVTEIFNAIDATVAYSSGDYRYVWPIPSTEMQNNPQLKGQQNPGY